MAPPSLDVPVPLRLRTPGAPDVSLLLEKLPMLIGRAPWVDLPITDRNVSHTHARLRLDGHRLIIDDMHSRNGTFVGDTRVGTGHVLRTGDRVRMGETEIVFGEAAGTADDNLETDPAMPLNGRRQETAGRTPIIATTIISSVRGAIAFTAAWRLVVA